MDNLSIIPFSSVNFNDHFFDSLKQDYIHGFLDWIANKSSKPNEVAHVLHNIHGGIEGFLYLKIEQGIDNDTNPPLPDRKHLKIGTFKFESAGTLRGQRFMKKIFDYAIDANVDDIYVTVFDKHSYLIKLFQHYGFYKYGTKTGPNGTENVLVRDMRHISGDKLQDYPYVLTRNTNKHLLSIYPVYHTRLFPDSKLVTESTDIVKDISHANSIHKIYICAMDGVLSYKAGDIVVIYRTSDNKGPARYRSVASSICVVESVRTIQQFPDEASFVKHCRKFSVFTESELIDIYRKKRYPYIIQFTYNIALPKRITRHELIGQVGLNPNSYWGCMPISDAQFNDIVRLSETNHHLIIT
ncbi:N-acetyltransferase [Photobacterium swingsii]|uniref:N-acetyltransferase n=1 Tax=Photobacterium swingsii TaxID=680026 RepID=UPI00352D8DFF